MKVVPIFFGVRKAHAKTQPGPKDSGEVKTDGATSSSTRNPNYHHVRRSASLIELTCRTRTAHKIVKLKPKREK